MNKRIKKIFVSVLCMLWMIGMVGADKSAYAGSIPSQRQLPRLVDEAGLLTLNEADKLSDQLDDISEEWNCDVVVVTVDSLEGKSVTAYADDFYDYNGYGMGSSDNGILLLISMTERDWAITTYGKGIRVFTDEEQSYIMDRVQPKLSDGDYNQAFETFAKLCDESLELYDENGRGHDDRDFLGWLIRCFFISGIVALIIVIGMKGKLKTVGFQTGAREYVKRGSMNVTAQRDLFLYKNVTKTQKQSSSSGSGGSSTHRSSSGRSHGGSHGKF